MHLRPGAARSRRTRKDGANGNMRRRRESKEREEGGKEHSPPLPGSRDFPVFPLPAFLNLPGGASFSLVAAFAFRALQSRNPTFGLAQRGERVRGSRCCRLPSPESPTVDQTGRGFWESKSNPPGEPKGEVRGQGQAPLFTSFALGSRMEPGLRTRMSPRSAMESPVWPPQRYPAATKSTATAIHTIKRFLKRFTLWSQLLLNLEHQWRQ
nr:uncharacterized protein LOC132773480 [Anolis sagrei ordinatus]